MNYDELIRCLRDCWDESTGPTCDCDHCLFRDHIVEDGDFTDYTKCETAMVLSAADAIENISKAYQMMAEAYEAEVTKPRWIPVTERLPDDRVPVQVTYLGYKTGKKDTDLLACRYEGMWCYWDGEPCSYDECKVEITHWKPLSRPPKEEQA